MTESVWLVIAENGDYSDYTTWIASGWLSKVLAEEEAARLRQTSNQWRRDRDDFWKRSREYGRRKFGARANMFGILPYGQFTQGEDPAALKAEMEREVGTYPDASPEHVADGFTVVEVPVGKPGSYWTR